MSRQKLFRTILSIGAVTGVLFGGSSAPAQDVGPEANIQNAEAGDPIAELVVELDDVIFAQEKFWTGLQVSPVDAALRAQLDIPADQGVVVSGVESGSPAEEAGIQVYDVLLTIDDAAVTDTESLLAKLQEAGEGPEQVVLLRGGKRLSLELTPRQRQWNVVTFISGDQYRIGVRVAEADEALRSQLGLSGDQGLVVTEVVEESPAAKAGIELHDILLEFGGKPLKTTEDLTSQVQEVGDRAATMEFIRKGERQSVRVTPERQSAQPLVNFIEVGGFDVEVLTPLESEIVRLHTDVVTPYEVGNEPSQNEAQAQLQELIREMEALTERMEALQRSLREPEESAAGGGEAEPEGADGED